MDHRKNEQDKLWFRTDRVFRSNGVWYFATREGINVGPYPTQFEAEIEADLLKNQLKQMGVEASLSIIREFMLDTLDRQSNLNISQFTDYVVQESKTNLTIDTLFGRS